MSKFEVQDITELTERGGILVGRIVEGELRAGEKAILRGPDESTSQLEIKSVEFIDDIAAGLSRIALLLHGAPKADFLRILVPSGTIVEFL